jgi:hypothetical protein
VVGRCDEFIFLHSFTVVIGCVTHFLFSSHFLCSGSVRRTKRPVKRAESTGCVILPCPCPRARPLVSLLVHICGKHTLFSPRA